MKQYEVTFIVDPVLSGDEIKTTAKTYEDMLKDNSASIVHVDQMGLKQLAYPIKKRTTGVYYCVEYNTTDTAFLPKLELALKRDERILRFLNIGLDKHGIKYNEDKRAGRIGKKKEKVTAEIKKEIIAEKPGKTPTPPVKAASEEE